MRSTGLYKKYGGEWRVKLLFAARKLKFQAVIPVMASLVLAWVPLPRFLSITLLPFLV